MTCRILLLLPVIQLFETLLVINRYALGCDLGLPAVILSAAARHFDDRPVGAGVAAVPVAAAPTQRGEPSRSAGRKRKRATVVRSDDRPVGAPPPSAASNVTVDNLNDHVPFFDRPSARHAPTVRRR